MYLIIPALLAAHALGNTIILNNCPFPLAYKTSPYQLSPAILQPHASIPFDFETHGTTFKLSSVAENATQNIVQFEVSLWPDGSMVTYDISLQDGNPFGEYGYTFIPSSPNCASKICAPNNSSCAYVAPGEDINAQGQTPNTACALPVTLTGTVCGQV